MNHLQAQHLHELAAGVYSCITASRETDEQEQRFGLLTAAEQLAGELRELAWSHCETARDEVRELASIEGNATAALRFIEQGKIHGPGDNASVRLRMVREKAARARSRPERIDPALVAAFKADPCDETAQPIFDAVDPSTGFVVLHGATIQDGADGGMLIRDCIGQPVVYIDTDGLLSAWQGGAA